MSHAKILSLVAFISILLAGTFARAEEADSPSSDADLLAEIEGTWEGEIVYPPQRMARRVVKTLKGNEERVTYYDDNDAVTHVHTTEFGVNKADVANVFTYAKYKVVQGPGADRPASTNAFSYFYRIDGDNLYEMHGLHLGTPPRQPLFIVWKRVQH